MIGTSRLQPILAIAGLLLIACLFSQAQVLSLPAALPDIVPSTVIADGAPAFHLDGMPNQLIDSNTASGTTAAQEDNQEGFVTRALKRGLEDQKEIWTSPFHRKNL